ncbi:MAG: hypothetical protein GYB18_08365 [Oceanospirillales bacterium]|nr:hypothetical protein [Oceanospirillales bacterium]
MNKLFVRTTIKPEHNIVSRGVVVTGDTIAYKSIIKRFGGKWNAEARGWQLETEEQAQWVVDCFNERKNKSSNAKTLDRKKTKADSAYAEEEKLVALSGETYLIKQQLEERFGAKWGVCSRAMLVDPGVAEEAQEFVSFGGKTAEEVDDFLSGHAELAVDGVAVSRYKLLLSENGIELKEQAVKEFCEEQVAVSGRGRRMVYEKQIVARFNTKLFVERSQEVAASSLISQQIAAETAEKKRIEESEAAEKVAYELKLAAVKKPSSVQVMFVQEQLQLLKRKGWNHADNVHEYRGICSDYPDYFLLMGWPADLRGSAARDWNGKI